MLNHGRMIILAVGGLLVVSACASSESNSGADSVAGFIFIDSDSSVVCETVLESYPPQCGGPSVRLLDLDSESVVALTSDTEPTSDALSWTDYRATVEGSAGTDGLSDVVLSDPVYSESDEELELRVADLGIAAGEPVTWPFDLTNLTGDGIMLTFTDGQHVEVTLSDEGGEVYRSSDGMFFTQAIELVDIPAGGRLPFVLTADPIDLPPGTYTARGWITALETGDLVVTWQVTIAE